MEKTTIKTTTYVCDPEFFNGFRIDIVETETKFEAWLYHTCYSVKSEMFGYSKKQHEGCDDITEEYFMEVVKNAYMDYIRDYIEDYCD